MEDKDILMQPMEDDSPFSTFLRRRRSRRTGVRVLAALLLIAAAAALGWYLLQSRDAAPSSAAVPGTGPGPNPPAAMLGSDEPLELPAVDTSDAFVRRLIARLSAHPQFAEWLVTDELARRFVATIADLAQGSSPLPHLRFMAPTEPFRVRESLGNMVVDATGYLRYDAMTATFASLDTDGTARLVRRLGPLFERAHAELGLQGRTFEGDLARAIENLLAVDVPLRPPAVVRGEEGWLYADPQLEARSSAARHLMRMGPDNAQVVQAKLAELAVALGIQPRDTASSPSAP